MDRIRKARGPVRSAVTRTLAAIEVELDKSVPAADELEVFHRMLDKHYKKLVELDDQLYEALLDGDVTEADLETESVAAEDYSEKVVKAKVRMDRILRRAPSPTQSVISCASASEQGSRRKTYKLPKIEIKKFNGELTEWLGFWAQFQKIDEDEELHTSDKFQYLVQSMVTGTRARELVDSYPQSVENYPKVIQVLKERFGKKKLLMQVYVRELLRMVINNNAVKDPMPLGRMYDRLEAHLRALESLDVTPEQMAVFLFPMVESSLPEEVLVAWQRSPFNGRDGTKDIPPKGELDFLMQFLRQEVENEEQRTLVQSGFSTSKVKKKSQSYVQQVMPSSKEDIPTASTLFSSEKSKCLFCEGSHESKDCMKAQQMALEEKQNRIKLKKCCFSCLRHGHLSKNCKVFVKCVVCGKRHFAVVCPDLPKHKRGNTKNLTNEHASEIQVSSSNLSCSTKVILKSLIVDVKGKNSSKKVRAIMDDGSHRSYISKSVAEELGLSSCGEEDLIHSLFSGVETSVTRHRKYKLKLKNASGRGFSILTVLDQDKICGSIPRLTRGPWMTVLKEQKIWISDLGLREETYPEIQLLIGADAVGKLLTGKIIQLPNGLTAVESVLGWTLMGEIRGPSVACENVAMTVTSRLVSDASVEQLWKLETIGITDPSEHKSKFEKDFEVKQKFWNTVTRDETGRYSVSLPWVDGVQKIPDNKAIAQKRLDTVTAKLQRDGKLADYDKIFRDWEEEGIIETVGESDYTKPSYYLPHRAVLKPESLTTPIRPVFDASCKSQRSPSLNECLEKGPNLFELLPTILLGFRERNIGITSDIRKAFQMIEMRDEDRDFLRFLWWEDPAKRKPKIFRHRRVVFGVSSSPFLLGAVLEHHLIQVEEEKIIAAKLLKSFYVDNCVLSLDTVGECQRFRDIAESIMSQAQMELRQWECGSAKVSGIGQLSSSWCGLDTGGETSQLDRSEGEVSVLGLIWDKGEDTLRCSLNEETLPEKVTKRTILSLTQKIFDPIGFTCPTTIIPKLILQNLWKDKTGWDDHVSEDTLNQFKTWQEELHHLNHIRIPRIVTGGLSNRQTWQIHTFCDASQHAYAAEVFLRTELDSNVSVQLLQAKSRVSPIKKTSIPRLELIGCTIAARLASSVQKALSLNGVPLFFWSDSTTALAWIRRNDNWGTFVGNRVKEICQLTAVDSWRHVPGSLNPADLPSRGCSPQQLSGSRWWEGPAWLRKSAFEWPSEIEEADEETVNSEKKKSPTVSMMNSTVQTPWYVISSSFHQNIRIVGWIKRFGDKCRRKSQSIGPLSIEEIEGAERNLLRVLQRESLPIGESIVGGLRVLTDEDGLLRIKTKLTYRDDSRGFRYPILLPNSHVLVDQLIREMHSQHKHGGVQFLMGTLREKYWIIQGRRTIRRVLGKCVICRRFTSKKSQVIPAPLPADRVGNSCVFEVTGVDLAGPLYLKDKSKSWIVLFTCAVFRAVHLELVTSLSTEGFLLSLRRFIARRGRPRTMYCDNGTNFVGSDNALKDLDWKKVLADTEIKRITWKFDPPSAPWWGGWWERLIQSTKGVLKRILGRSSLDYEELMTCLCDAEAVINGRPLTYVSEDPEDLIPLTPAMFLQDIQTVDVSDLDSLDSTGFQRRFRYRQKLRDELRSRFRKEYLSLLVQHGKETKIRKFEVGDVVLVETEKKRIFWPMARITELIPGKDGNVRLAKLKTASGNLLRPIQRLYPLEVSSANSPPISPNVKKIAVEEVKKSRLNKRPAVCTRSGRKVIVPVKYSD